MVVKGNQKAEAGKGKGKHLEQPREEPEEDPRNVVATDYYIWTESNGDTCENLAVVGQSIYDLAPQVHNVKVSPPI